MLAVTVLRKSLSRKYLAFYGRGMALPAPTRPGRQARASASGESVAFSQQTRSDTFS